MPRELSCPLASTDIALRIFALLAACGLAFWATFWLAADQRADLLAADGPDHVPLAHQREHHDRQPVVHAQGDRRGVHDLEPAAEVLAVVQPLEADRARRSLR